MHEAPTTTWHGWSSSVEQTMAIGRTIAQHARCDDLVAVSGELGTGKTVFVRGMAQGLGVDEQAVCSPTFVIVHEYEPPSDSQGRPMLMHIDAYRLTSLADLESIGWDTPMPEMRRNAVVVIEWADRLEDRLGDDRLGVRLDHTGEHDRRLTVTAHGSWVDRFADLRAALDATASSSLKPTECPICGKPAPPDSGTFPFCSERCKTIDLGRWADGRYVISRPIERSDLDEGE